MYIANANPIPISNEQEYFAYLQKVEKQVKEICPQCKNVLDEIFRLRLQNLSQLSLDLLGIYFEPTKDNPYDKKKE